MSGPTLSGAKDVAQQVVTLLLNDERDAAAKLALEYPQPTALALVLGDLVACVHSSWAGITGTDRDETWRLMLLRIEAWRLTHDID